MNTQTQTHVMFNDSKGTLETRMTCKMYEMYDDKMACLGKLGW